MKNLSLSILAVSSAVVLGACSSNSDGHGHKPTTPMVNPSNPDKPTNPTNPTNPTTNAKITGKSVVINDKDDSVKQVDVSSDNINQLLVNGQKFQLAMSGITSGTFSDINQNASHSVISGTHLSHAKYGYWWDKQAGMEYFFYQGEKTPVANMSKLKGVVNYTGLSVYGCADCNSQMIKGNSQFKADFDNKTIAGTISNSKATVQLTADIKGNTFVNDGSKTGIQVDGAFFGNNAEELSGIYLDKNKNFAGAFGAKK